jgi:AcrR family transcriptional regulator
MPRAKSDDKRSAILSAAIRLIATEGLGVATATIAKEARISNGSLFTYFETKANLFNELYLELKSEMAMAAFKGFPPQAELRDQFSHVWSNWMSWAVRNHDKRRVLAHLGASDEITPASRAAGHKIMAGIAELLERSRAKGPIRDAPIAFVVAIMNSLSDATMDFMAQDPANADRHRALGFDALWRVVS